MRRIFITTLVCCALGFAWFASRRAPSEVAHPTESARVAPAPALTADEGPAKRPLDDAFKKAMEVDTTAAAREHASHDGAPARAR